MKARFFAAITVIAIAIAGCIPLKEGDVVEMGQPTVVNDTVRLPIRIGNIEQLLVFNVAREGEPVIYFPVFTVPAPGTAAPSANAEAPEWVRVVPVKKITQKTTFGVIKGRK